MARRILFALSAAALLTASDVFAAGPIGTIKIGPWTGGVFTNDATGAFDFCLAGAATTTGIAFIVYLDASGGWSLAFMHPSWQLQPNEAFPIDLTFDGQAAFHVSGAPVRNNNSLVRVPMPATSALMAQFRKSATMTALAKGQRFGFRLDYTSRLLPALANCVAFVKANGIARASDFSVEFAPGALARESVSRAIGNLKPSH